MTTQPQAQGAVKKLLRVKAAAERLDVSPMTVYRLVYAKQLPAVPVGLGKKRPRIRISESALEAFMAAGTGSAA